MIQKTRSSGLVGLLAHDFTDEALDGSDPVLDFAAAEDLGAMDVPGSQIGPGTFAKVLMLNPDGAVWSGRQGRMFSATSLDARLLVGRDHEVIGAQWRVLPRDPGRDRGWDRHWPQNWDHAGRSSFDAARGGERRC